MRWFKAALAMFLVAVAVAALAWRLLSGRIEESARRYVENLSMHVSTFFDWWLDRSEWIPNTSNLIENRFSQVKNRIKRIGKRWSDDGLQKWLMVVIQKIFTPENWTHLWDQFLDINKPLVLDKISISYVWLL